MQVTMWEENGYWKRLPPESVCANQFGVRCKNGWQTTNFKGMQGRVLQNPKAWKKIRRLDRKEIKIGFSRSNFSTSLFWNFYGMPMEVSSLSRKQVLSTCMAGRLLIAWYSWSKLNCRNYYYTLGHMPEIIRMWRKSAPISVGIMNETIKSNSFRRFMASKEERIRQGYKLLSKVFI